MIARASLAVAAIVIASSTTGSLAAPDCLCRADGRFFKQGETTCIRTPTGLQTVRCAMSQNVTTWKPTGETCPTAMLSSQVRDRERSR